MPSPRSTRVLALVVLLFLLAGGLASLELAGGGGAVRVAQVAPVAAVRPAFDRRIEPALPTTTTSSTVPAPPPTTRPAPPPAASRVVQPASPVDDAFWRRLANCESPNGADGGFNGYFQLAGSTAKAVGYHGGSYEEQLAAAKRWLAIIGVAKAGTRAGWPVCWWVALRG